MSKVIGIDLGTTNSAVAVHRTAASPRSSWKTPKATALPRPSISFRPGRRPRGRQAGQERRPSPTPRTPSPPSSASWAAPTTRWAAERKGIAYNEVKRGKDGRCVVDVDGHDYTPEEISAMIMRQAQGRCRGQGTWARRSPRPSSPCPPTSTTPSARPPRTPAGSPVSRSKRIINEPTAAALAYGLDKNGAGSRRSWCSTWAAAPSTSRILGAGRRRVRGARPPTATTTWAATTGTSASSIGWPTSSTGRERQSTCARTPWPCSA